MTNLGKVAAAIHADMCNDNANGYSWSPRWGKDGLGVKTIAVDGKQYSYDRGSYDCSSSVITAWKAALAGTKYARLLDGASFTGNMRGAFVASGLFEWKPMSFLAEPGDLYLNVANHVAMCQTQTPDVLSEFSMSENGNVYQNQTGDQTGKEASVHGYYDYPWDGILHYNGKADTEDAKREAWDVQQFTANLTDAQMWQPKQDAQGYVTLISKANGKALDVAGASVKNGTKVQVYTPNGTDAQKWKIERQTKTPSKGAYSPLELAPVTLAPKCAPKMRLDVKNGSKAVGAPLQLYQANNTNAQNWYVIDNGNGFWSLVNVGSHLMLDVKNGGK